MKTHMIADIDKEIVRNRENRDYDMFIVIDGQREYIGSAPNYSKAEETTNQYVYDYLTDGHTIESAAEFLMEVAA
jgi:hypothetical protein